MPAKNLAFSFGIGFFYGIFVIDLAYSAQIIIKIREFAQEREIILKLEELREDIYHNIHQHAKRHFLFSLHTGRPIREILEQYKDRHFDGSRLKEELQRHIRS